jgi:hypothetical protein
MKSPGETADHIDHFDHAFREYEQNQNVNPRMKVIGAKSHRSLGSRSETEAQ